MSISVNVIIFIFFSIYAWLTHLNDTPLYLDWTFWSFVVASIALILSQLPNVNMWFKRNQIDLEIHNRITINHWLGIPGISLFLGVNNKGRAKIRIKTIELIISREQKTIATLTCNSFFDTPVSQSPNLFFPFELPSENSWDHSCWFTVESDRNTEQKIRGWLSALDMDISEKTKSRTDQSQLLEANESLVNPLIQHKEKTFIWEPGEYFVQINLYSEPKINISKKFRFTLFESDTKELIAYSDDYKYGMGYHNQKNKGINIPISKNSTL